MLIQRTVSFHKKGGREQEGTRKWHQRQNSKCVEKKHLIDKVVILSSTIESRVNGSFSTVIAYLDILADTVRSHCHYLKKIDPSIFFPSAEHR